jgi:hypothetical protein
VSSGANVYGGGIALSIGAYSYSRSGSSVVSGITHVQRCSYTISSNTLTNCSASSLTNSSGFLARSVGANVYGGGISLKEGAYSYGSSSNVSGGTRVSYTSYNVSFNRLTDCTSSSVTSDPGLVISRISSGRSFGANVYGGGISLAVGPYSYCKGSNSRFVNALGSSTIGGNTTVENISYSILGNNVIRCRASSVTSGGGSSNGANVYGGGLSLLVGSYSYGQLLLFRQLLYQLQRGVSHIRRRRVQRHQRLWRQHISFCWGVFSRPSSCKLGPHYRLDVCFSNKQLVIYRFPC